MNTVIFDMDGVLVDSEPLKARAHIETTSYFGGMIGPELYERHLGHSLKRIARAIIHEAALPTSTQAYAACFKQTYETLIHEGGIDLHAGAKDLVQRFVAERWHLGLVTSAFTSETVRILRHVELYDAFAVIVTADDVAAAKPSPEPYLLAFRRLGAALRRTVVFEDTDVGILAATRAGLRVIGCRHALNRLQRFDLVQFEVDSLTDCGAIFGGALGLINDTP